MTYENGGWHLLFAPRYPIVGLPFRPFVGEASPKFAAKLAAVLRVPVGAAAAVGMGPPPPVPPPPIPAIPVG